MDAVGCRESICMDLRRLICVWRMLVGGKAGTGAKVRSLLCGLCYIHSAVFDRESCFLSHLVLPYGRPCTYSAIISSCCVGIGKTTTKEKKMTTDLQAFLAEFGW